MRERKKPLLAHEAVLLELQGMVTSVDRLVQEGIPISPSQPAGTDRIGAAKRLAEVKIGVMLTKLGKLSLGPIVRIQTAKKLRELHAAHRKNIPESVQIMAMAKRISA